MWIIPCLTLKLNYNLTDNENFKKEYTAEMYVQMHLDYSNQLSKK